MKAKASTALLLVPPIDFGLRDYGTAAWEGGNPECGHVPRVKSRSSRASGGLTGGKATVDAGTVLRDRCHCGATRIDQQLGLEPTPDEYVAKLVEVFREARRVLHRTGTLWIVIGDSYCSSPPGNGVDGVSKKSGLHGANTSEKYRDTLRQSVGQKRDTSRIEGLKPKDLIGVPWMLAFALRADGWYLRQDIVWAKCISGGAVVYAQTAKGEMPTTVKDLARLDPSTVRLWDGEKWNQMTAIEPVSPCEDRIRMSLRQRHRRYQGQSSVVEGDIEIELRSGERIGCTRDHRWPTNRGLLFADELAIGDVVEKTILPEPYLPVDPENLPAVEVGWFVGLYIAEGNLDTSGTIVISSHRRETDRFERLCRFAESFGGQCKSYNTSENGMSIDLHGAVLRGILNAYIGGSGARGKHLTTAAWQRSNTFLRAVLEGYLSGDGHLCKDERWALGFCDNDQWTSDLRTIAARIDASVRLRRVQHSFDGRLFPGWRGSLYFDPDRRKKPDTQIVAITQSRARQFWDISLAEEPHTFSLASGLLTHNSAPMPESVRDRPTRSHEYVFLLAKSESYFYDAAAIAEPVVTRRDYPTWQQRKEAGEPLRRGDPSESGHVTHFSGLGGNNATRNKRDVWSIGPQPSRVAHYASYPEALVEPMVLAGCPEGGTVLDPFTGSGTTLAVAVRLGRSGLGIELNPDYVALAEKRLRGETTPLALFEEDAS